MIEEQVHFWKLSNSTEDKPYYKHPLPIITISREFGARGLEIATRLEQLIGFKVWDKDLLEVISERLGSNTNFLADLDERRQNAIEDAIFGFMNHKGTNLNYLLYLVRAIHAIEKFGNAIIVGRGGNFICRNKKTFNVRIVAPFADRVNHIAQKEGLSKEEARIVVKNEERARSEFTLRNFNHDTSKPTEYDLVINSATMGVEGACEVIIKGYEQKIGQHIRIPEMQ